MLERRRTINWEEEWLMLAFGSSCKGSEFDCKDLAIKRGAPPHCARSYADKKPAFIPLPPASASGTQALDFR